jgi:hypothetical protein
MSTTKNKTPKLVEGETYAKTGFTPETLRYIANELNGAHGAGPQCAIAFDKGSLNRLVGIVAATAHVDDYFIIPCRDRWDTPYTPEEIGALL